MGKMLAREKKRRAQETGRASRFWLASEWSLWRSARPVNYSVCLRMGESSGIEGKGSIKPRAANRVSTVFISCLSGVGQNDAGK